MFRRGRAWNAPPCGLQEENLTILCWLAATTAIRFLRGRKPPYRPLPGHRCVRKLDTLQHLLGVTIPPLGSLDDSSGLENAINLHFVELIAADEAAHLGAVRQIASLLKHGVTP